ncbi:MAG: DUF4235 domain-containing protein [Cyclobacteriaceae bacterium]
MSLLNTSDIFNEKNQWSVVSSASSMIAAFAARRLIGAAWTLVAKKQPPKNVSNWSVGWGEAIGYMALAGAIGGVVRVFALRGATLGWKTALGSFPPEARKKKKKKKKLW